MEVDMSDIQWKENTLFRRVYSSIANEKKKGLQ